MENPNINNNTPPKDLEEEFWTQGGNDIREEFLQKLNDICYRATLKNLPVEISEILVAPYFDNHSLKADICVKITPRSQTPEYKLFEKMMDEAFLSNLLHQLENQFSSPAQATPVLVASLGIQDANQISTLTALFSEWLKRVSFSTFHFTMRHKPSNANWDGFGYEFWKTVPRLLSHYDGFRVLTGPYDESIDTFPKIYSKGDAPKFSKEEGYQETAFYKNMKSKVFKELKEIYTETAASKKRQREEMPEEDKLLSSYEQEERAKKRVKKEDIDIIAESREAFRLFYQLKVSIKNTPVWRMVVISGSVTFDNLHKILSIAFGYDEDSNDYCFETSDGISILKGKKKVEGEKLSAASTKWCSTVKYAGDKVNYRNGKWNMEIIVDKVNFSKNQFDVETTPRCVDGAFASTGMATPSEYKAPKSDKFDADKVNKVLMTRRFARNSAQNQIPKTGPTLIVPTSISQADFNKIALNAYKQKLV